MAYKIPAQNFLPLILNRKEISGTYVANPDDELLGIIVDGTYTITLPNAAVLTNGKCFVVVDETGSINPNTVTINTGGGNIDGSSSVGLGVNYGIYRFFAYSGNYWTW